MIVSEAAADLRIPQGASHGSRTVTLPMPGVNHIEICKFAREDDPNYQMVLSRLEMMTASLFPQRVKEEKQQLFIEQITLEIQHLTYKEEGDALFRQGEEMCEAQGYRSEAWKRFRANSWAMFHAP